MTESQHVIESHEYEEVPEEVVETSYMCGECFQLFPTTEGFNKHHCQVTEVESVGNQEGQDHDPSTSCVRTEVWEAGESEAAMEEAVASILGERMKLTSAPQRSETSQLKRTLIISEENSVEHHIEPVLQHPGENTVQIELERHMDGVEIPSTNLYVYDNASYLHKLMKDNTFGRRVRHDAPYTDRLGPWDNKSSRYLIQLLKEYPKAYFILDKEMKRTEAWEIIRHRLAEAGYQFTVLQIRMRWRELCKKYRNTVNHNDMYNTKKTCQYFEDLNNLFGVWDKGATLLLIRQLDNNCRKGLGQNGGTRMRIRVWEHIRQVLAAHGYQYTADQVQGRWSNLVTLYQRMVEHNSKPYNEPITVAFKEHIERIFNYVPERNSKWLKIMEKRGKTPKPLAKRWTLSAERILLAAYQERVYRFNNEHISNHELWHEISQKLLEKGGSSYSVEKVRTRFYELTKQFSTTEHHNSQPGTIRRECRHHFTLTQIYSIYNYWPHDKSTIKLENSNAVRMRQVNAQLGWTDSQSRMLLQLYPQVLVAHLSTGEHQPIEELWLQLAKAFLNATNEKKQCYELEEHLWLLRRGHHSHNPFPFTAEMQLLEETEATLGFVTGQLSTGGQQAGVSKHQLVPYWSHTAAHLLLDLVLHHRQEGVKNAALFEMISTNMAGYSYRYTGEECRTYYMLLRQLYTNRLRTIKRNKELIKPFPYMDKMAEIDAITSQPKFTETEENLQRIIQTAQEKLECLKMGSEEENGCGREHLVNWLTNLKMALKRTGLHPPPPIKNLARVILGAIENPSDGHVSAELGSVLGPHLKSLQSVAERGGTYVVYQPGVVRSKGRRASSKSTIQQKYSSVQWTDNNVKTMLDTVKEWKLLCHDDAEFESILANVDTLWKEVATRIGEHTIVDPAKCQERFSQMCREYRSVMSFNARLGPEDGVKSVPCQEILEYILSPLICNEAELDVRDLWWASEESGEWSWMETVELLFTVREFWPNFPKDGWEMVSSMMKCSGYQRGSVECQEKFDELYGGYKAAAQHNLHCTLRTRRRPPFYFKICSLFSQMQPTPPLSIKMSGCYDIEVEEKILIHTLVGGLRQLKRHQCHSVPRIPLLLALAQHLNSSFQCSPPIFTSFRVWQLMVDLHRSHLAACEEAGEGPEDIDLEDLWEKHPNPVVAYGLHAQPHSGWQQVNEWCAEEVFYLLEGISSRELQPRSTDTATVNTATSASNSLKAHGFNKTPMQCQDQWLYMVATFRLGGYRQFINQLRLISVLSPSLVQSHHSHNSSNSFQCDKHSHQKTETLKVEDKEQKTGKHAVKKLKMDMKDTAVLTVSEENWERRKLKNSAPGDVISYVQINVPWITKPDQRHVQVATDEPESIKGEKVHEAMLSIKKEPEDMTSSITADEPSKYTENTRQECLDGEQELPEVYSKAISESRSLSDSGGKQNDRIQVEILSIAEAENSKVVECRTVKGVIPERTIRLHYPSDHPLPSGMKHMNIPAIMVYPDIMATDRDKKLSRSPAEMQSSNPSFMIPKEEVAVFEEKQAVAGAEHFDKVNENYTVEPGKREVLDLLTIYKNENEEREEKWLKNMQNYHHHQISLLKKAMSIFREFQECF